jgi:hypothetical protein
MQQLKSITRETPRVVSRLARLRTGDFVLVWDGVKERNIWQRVAETRTAGSGRLKIRVEGAGFFFDEGIVISYVGLAGSPAPLAIPGGVGRRAPRRYAPEWIVRLLRRKGVA